MAALLGARYIERCIAKAELYRHWYLKVEAQLWCQGNLTMQDYFLLKAEPGLVKLIFPFEADGNLDKALETRLSSMARQKATFLEPGAMFENFCDYALGYGTLDRDLPLQVRTRLDPVQRSLLLHAAIRHHYLELVQELLPQVTPHPIYLRTAFRYKRWVLSELLMAAPYNLQPTLTAVIVGGRPEDVERFGYSRRLLDPELEALRESSLHGALAATSPALFDLWYGAVQGRTPEELLAQNLAVIFFELLSETEQPNLELLEHLDRTYPDMTAQHVALVFEDYWESIDQPLSLLTVIEHGNRRLLEVVFNCLERYQP